MNSNNLTYDDVYEFFEKHGHNCNRCFIYANFSDNIAGDRQHFTIERELALRIAASPRYIDGETLDAYIDKAGDLIIVP